MNRTSIEWTHRPETGGAAGGFTWNPIRARLKTIITDAHGRDANGDKLRTGTFCTRISPGCTNCGGESGHGARPFNLAWAESLLKQCRSANVPFFMKQMGSNAHWQHDDARCSHETGQCSAGRLASTDPKGGDPAEWPDHVRVREFPLQKVEVVSA